MIPAIMGWWLVGVGGASQPSRILGGGDGLTGRFLAALEGDPPQRHAAEEGDHERRDVGRGRLGPSEGRAGAQERLAQGDDEEKAIVAIPSGMATIARALTDRTPAG